MTFAIFATLRTGPKRFVLAVPSQMELLIGDIERDPELENFDMDLKSLQYFVAIINFGSFTRASQHLRIAQPALGWQIRKLEVELNCKLLVRHSKGVVPTSAGMLLLGHARDILNRTGLAIEQFRDFAGGAGKGRQPGDDAERQCAADGPAL